MAARPAPLPHGTDLFLCSPFLTCDRDSLTDSATLCVTQGGAHHEWTVHNPQPQKGK